jgi:hypothetical protein
MMINGKNLHTVTFSNAEFGFVSILHQVLQPFLIPQCTIMVKSSQVRLASFFGNQTVYCTSFS